MRIRDRRDIIVRDGGGCDHRKYAQGSGIGLDGKVRTSGVSKRLRGKELDL